MSKFLLLYRGPATSPADISPEQGEEIMKAWGDWIARVGAAMADVGAPLGERTAVGDDGSSPEPSDQNGYSVVEADSLNGARALVDKHPFLTEGKGRFSVEIFKLEPIDM